MPFLDAVHERVVVFDGAFGTYIQLRELTVDDFGGPELEGCNEMLGLTRPDVIARLHAVVLRRRRRRGRDGHLRRVRDRPGRVRYRRPSPRDQPRRGPHRAEVRDDFVTDGRPRFVAGSIGPGTKLPSLGHIRFADAARRLRGAGARPARGRRRPAPHRDVLRPAAGEGGDHRRAGGRWPPRVARCRCRCR